MSTRMAIVIQNHMRFLKSHKFLAASEIIIALIIAARPLPGSPK